MWLNLTELILTRRRTNAWLVESDALGPRLIPYAEADSRPTLPTPCIPTASGNAILTNEDEVTPPENPKGKNPALDEFVQ